MRLVDDYRIGAAGQALTLFEHERELLQGRDDDASLLAGVGVGELLRGLLDPLDDAVACSTWWASQAMVFDLPEPAECCTKYD